MVSSLRQLKSWVWFLAPAFLIFGYTLLGHRTLGADYTSATLDEALYLRFFVKLGLEPMWAMHLSGGVPIGGLPMAQQFYFPAWVLSMLPGYFSGKALMLFSLKNILLLALGQYGVWLTVRKLARLDFWPAYALSFLTIYNAATLDAFRYNSSLDAGIFTLLLVSSILVFLQDGRRFILLLTVLLTQLLLTSGYPPTFPFTLLLGVLGFALFVFYWRPEFSVLKKRVLYLAGAFGVGLLLSAPNWLPLSEWLEVNFIRMHYNNMVDWAELQPLDTIKLLSNFVRPWSAEIHSAFGGTVVTALLLGVLLVEFFRSPKRLWIIPILALLPLTYAYGFHSPVYVFFFRFIPGFSHIRGAGRIFIIWHYMLIILAIAVERRERISARTFQIVGGVYLVFLLYCIRLQAVYPGGGWKGLGNYEFSPEHLTHHFWTQSWKMAWLILGILACVSFARLRSPAKLRWPFPVFMLLIFLQSLLFLPHGTFESEGGDSTRFSEMQAKNYLPDYFEMTGAAGNDLSESVAGAATIQFTNFFNAAKKALNCYYPIEPELAARNPAGVAFPFYLSNVIRCGSGAEGVFARLRLETCDLKHSEAVTHVFLDGPECVESSGAGRAGLGALNRGNRLTALTPNGLEMKVVATTDSIFVTSFPFISDYWSGILDGLAHPLERVNGSLVGMKVPQGEHVVGVRYFSKRLVYSWRFFLLGMVLLLVALLYFEKKKRIYLGAIILVLAAYPFVENRMIESAGKKILLHNNYAVLLQKQLQHWK